MKRSPFSAAGILVLTAVSFGSAQELPDQTVRIGTFDSRAVALAYYRSPDGIERMIQEWDQRWGDAEAAGDSVRMEELKLFKPSFQHLMHQQVFSTGSICNVLREVENDLPGIAAAAGVSGIVSRWELPYSASELPQIDVTPQIVALFDVDENVASQVAQMKDVEPVPLEQLLYQPDH